MCSCWAWRPTARGRGPATRSSRPGESALWDAGRVREKEKGQRRVFHARVSGAVGILCCAGKAQSLGRAAAEREDGAPGVRQGAAARRSGVRAVAACAGSRSCTSQTWTSRWATQRAARWTKPTSRLWRPALDCITAWFPRGRQQAPCAAAHRAQTSCDTLTACLRELWQWSRFNPKHTPLMITIEYKASGHEPLQGTLRIPWCRCRGSARAWAAAEPQRPAQLNNLIFSPRHPIPDAPHARSSSCPPPDAPRPRARWLHVAVAPCGAGSLGPGGAPEPGPGHGPQHAAQGRPAPAHGARHVGAGGGRPGGGAGAGDPVRVEQVRLWAWPWAAPGCSCAVALLASTPSVTPHRPYGRWDGWGCQCGGLARIRHRTRAACADMRFVI